MKYCLVFFFTISLQAQIQFAGIVKDASTNKPLSFATITLRNNTKFITEIDGKFSISTEAEISSFLVSYIGYENIYILIEKNKPFYTVFLTSKITNFNAVAIANQNPVLAIIKKAIDRKDSNNPQKKFNSFQFKSYNKMLVSANPDSLKGKIDSVFITKNDKKIFKKIDSADFKFKKIISKQHLFLTEKVSQFQFSNKKLKETILGTKMAGFKQPVYEILGFNLQSFSIYDNHYDLLETKYNSPIANDALRKYNFKLLDTIAIDGRNTYLVYFRNKRKNKSSGLEGTLYIDSENYAIAKAVMRIKSVIDISGIHEFSYIAEQKIWFPVNKTFKIVKGKNDDDIKILGGTIQFDGDINSNLKPRQKVSSDYTYLLSQTDNFDLQYNVPVIIKKSFVGIEIKDNAIKKSESFWQTYRKDSLDVRSQKTYLVLDSIGVKQRIESRVRLGRKIINGYFPIRFFDFDLRKIISFNNYEGFRLGFGGVTNEQFSKKYRAEGYFAYGTKDNNIKYSLGFATRIGKFSNSWIGASYTNDVKEIASTTFSIDKQSFKLYDPRPINISTFYNYKNWKSYLETRIIPKTESIWEFSHTVVEPKFNYIYNLNGRLYNSFTMTTAMVSLQWDPFSDYMQTPTGRIETEKRFPKFTFQYTQTLPKIWNNDFAFGKLDFRTEYEKKYLNGQKTSLLLEAGYAFGDIPLTHLYNTSPNSLLKDKVLERITFAGKNSFETMYFNEFFSSEFAFLQFKHGFNRIGIFKKIKPSVVIVTRMAWGNIKNPEQHIGLDYKTLNNGYFESGIELNQIYNGLGLSGFYRYGPNQLLRFEDNLAIKLSFVLNLGL